jgi:signal transduction histidine kinase/ligand-binding sensor domain-containing protein/DNA-binding response OmpR family regulator
MISYKRGKTLKKLIFLIQLLLLSGYCSFLSAANETIRIVNYSYKDGLTSSGVNSVFKDSRGFLWICSNNGLFRYDGYNFKNINSIANGNLKYETYCIAEDKNQNFWIGTAGKGVFYYNSHSGKLFNLQLSSGNNSKVNRILFFHKKIWIATDAGLLAIDENDRIDSNTKLPTTVLLPDPQHKYIQTNVINFIYTQTGSNSLWIGTNSSLFELDPGTFRFRYINSYNQQSIRWLANYDSGKILVSSWDGGVFVVNAQTHSLANDQFINDINKIIGDKRVKSAVIDNQNRCWITTFGEGLYIFGKAKDGKLWYENYRSDENKPLRIKSNYIDQIFIDDNGAAWISTSVAGLSKIYYQKNSFYNFEFKDANDPYRSKEILAVSSSSDPSKYWINFNLNEIDLFDAKKGDYKQFTSKSSGLQLQNDKVSSVFQDRKGNLWIVYNRIGLFVVPAIEAKALVSGTLSKTVKPIDANGLLNYLDPRANSYITCFFEDSKGRLWVGAWGETRILELKENFGSSHSSDEIRANSRVYEVYVEPQKGNYKFTISPVNAIVEVEPGKFWLGTRDAGIIEFNEISENRFEGKNLDLNEKLPSDNIKCFYIDQKGTLWIGTNSGLCHLYKGQLRVFNVKNGLSSESINNIAGDKNQNLWIATSYGISKIDIRDFSISNFFHTDKENLNQYITHAASVLPSGELLFSTTESLVSFYPDSFEIDKISAPVYFTDIKINNSTIIPLDKFKGTRIIECDLNESKEVRVPYGSTLSIEFAALDYLTPERILYKYKIGKSEWIMLSPGQRILNLPNMNSGVYTLTVMVANSTDKNNTRSIKIHYLPPFWLSKIAYIIYFVIALSLLFTYRKLIIQRILQKSLIEKERYERKKLEELDKMKSEFFSNISHEFRTPLSLIINPLDKLINETDISDKNKDKIRLILKSSNRLLKLTNELMDFSKVEKELLKPDFQLCEIVSMTSEICLLFNNLADSMNIEFKINHSFDRLEIPIDKGMIEKTIFNLLSNAFKYTSLNGVIMVNLSKVHENGIEFAKISVVNTGEGIHKEYLSKIFDRYYQVNNVQNRNFEGTGIGLALVKSFVELHKGRVEVKSEPKLETSFDIYLPIEQEGFNKEDDSAVAQSKKIARNLPLVKDNKAVVSKPASHYRVLVVEDEDDIRDYIVEELSSEYKVLSAKNGEEALNIANETIPDLIITDVMMPVLSGIQLCTKLKNQVITSHIPIIILSAKTDINQQIEGLEMGADVYMIKPFNIDHLKAQILRLINFKQAIYSRYLKETNLIPQETMSNKLDEEFMQKIMSFIDDNLADSDLSVDQLANCVSLSKVQTYRKVKAISGLSIVEFIRTVRLKKAAQLILEGRLNFSEIAFETGFSTPSYFSKCFHDHFGKTPSEYALEYGSNTGSK